MKDLPFWDSLTLLTSASTIHLISFTSHLPPWISISKYSLKIKGFAFLLIRIQLSIRIIKTPALIKKFLHLFHLATNLLLITASLYFSKDLLIIESHFYIFPILFAFIITMHPSIWAHSQFNSCLVLMFLIQFVNDSKTYFFCPKYICCCHFCKFIFQFINLKYLIFIIHSNPFLRVAFVIARLNSLNLLFPHCYLVHLFQIKILINFRELH